MLFHIIERTAWETAKAQGSYRPPSLNAEGFIHFSKPEQVIATANRFYKGSPGLVLLQVDPSQLEKPLRYETVADHGTFPHLYGPLNLTAVTKVWPFEPSPEGHFTMPF
ncbi:MAG: DUF952 domain-containing protein [Phormidesmis sp.]